MNRPVTEFDLRADEFKHPDTKPEDLEFRADGKIVRKDRWEKGIRSIAAHMEMWGEWEITEVVARVERLQEHATQLAKAYCALPIDFHIAALDAVAKQYTEDQ